MFQKSCLSLIHFHLQIYLPNGWRDAIAESDQQWISRQLFKDQKLVHPLSLWYRPPLPPPIPTRPPKPHLYFARRLFVWMPYRIWAYKFVCSGPGCNKKQLTGAGPYKTVRKVLDIDEFYYLIGEVLECTNCKKKFISWSKEILDQLDESHRRQFRVILTHK